MSRVAAELGSSPMSLYRYVSAKDELLALMVDAAIETRPQAPAAEESWRANERGPGSGPRSEDAGSVRLLTGFDDLLRRCAADGRCGCILGRPDLHQHLVAARDPTG
jgi:AcrR family transcriptional regulator